MNKFATVITALLTVLPVGAMEKLKITSEDRNAFVVRLALGVCCAENTIPTNNPILGIWYQMSEDLEKCGGDFLNMIESQDLEGRIKEYNKTVEQDTLTQIKRTNFEHTVETGNGEDNK